MTEEDMNEYGKYIGRVKWFNKKKGYGFINIISEDLNGKDVFCHFSDINTPNYKLILPGEYVSCDVDTKEDDGKLVCKNITGVNGHPLMVDNEEYMFRVIPKNRDDN